MTQMVKQLETERLVERRIDPDDARASRIYLSTRARRLEPVAAEVLKDLDSLARRRLTAQGVVDLKAALRKVLELGD